MPCVSTPAKGQTLAQRMNQVSRALKRLEKALGQGAVSVKVGPSGAVVLTGWGDRDGISDVCAYRALTAEGSWELRRAVARAEATGGRRINPQAIAAGVHSHDGGHTWGRD